MNRPHQFSQITTSSTVDCADASTDWIEKPVSWFKRSICLLFSLGIINSLGIPLTQAQEMKRNQLALEALNLPQPADRYVQGFDLLEEAFAASTTSTNTSTNRSSAGAFNRSLSPFVPVYIQMAEEAQAMRDEWAKQRSLWSAANISPEILASQQETEVVFELKHAQLMALLKDASETGSPASVAALKAFVETERPSKTHLPVNLDNMPWQVEQPKPELPALSEEELDAKLFEPASASTTTTAKAHQTEASKDERQPLVTYRQAIDLDAEAPKTTVQTAGQAFSLKAGSMVSGKAITAATPADVAATLDAQQTAEIKALAASLDNNPHKIYQWVHDNIHYFPSQGSVQGAQDTLDKKRGNAFDTNSLLIALLRSAGIPSRYVYGTVEIPVAQVQNWVGGTATADAAQQLLLQGGVPNTILIKGGRDFAFRMEHVWVEALIQYHPGRGATHKPGISTPDTWVPMDGSYKQYTYAQGMDLLGAVPFEANALLAAAQQGAEINEEEGWVRNINSTAVEAQLQSYQNQLEGYINSQNSGNSTVGDVLGIKQAQIDPLPYLAGTLPYTIRARSQQFAEIPASRRAQFKYEMFLDQRSAAWGDSPVMRWQVPTANIAGKKVTIAWVAANAASQAAIDALIPIPTEGEALDPSQLPTGLSSSIRLKPEIRLDGNIVATGPAFRAGDEPIGAGSFTKYGTSQWDTTTDQLIAGQQTALGISIQGISQAQLEALKVRMEQTKQQLEQAQIAPQSQRETILGDTSGVNIMGDMLTASIWAYFSSLQNYGGIAGSQAKVIDLPGLQYGLFHAQVQPRKLYGIVNTGITFSGLNMDVGHVRSVRWVQDDNPTSPINDTPSLIANGKPGAQNRWIIYNRSKGQYSSAMEHVTPEEFWVNKSQCRYTDSNGQVQNSTLEACAEGISAVKALAIAQSQGQKIYTINQDNRATALPKLAIGGEAGDEIRNAIQAGKEVIFHESRINAHGWTGYGYAIVDQNTGAGSYIIEGGGNGGAFVFGILVGAGVAASIFLAPLIAVSALVLWPFYLIALALVVTSFVDFYSKASQEDIACFHSGVLLGVTALFGGAGLLLFKGIMTAGMNSIILSGYNSIATYGGIGTLGFGFFWDTPSPKSCI